MNFTALNFETFKKCCDSFEFFKAEFAANSSYVAAMFVHHFVFKRYQTLVVLADREVRDKIRAEIYQILQKMPDAYWPGIKEGIQEIESTTNWNRIKFSAYHDYALKGLTPTLVYSVEPTAVVNSCWLEPSDIPNLYTGIKFNNKNA